MRLLALIPILLLGACSAPRGGSSFALAPDQKAAAFDAARDVLRRHRFELERVDAERGVITTQPKATAGLATPWDTEQSSLQQEVQEWLNHEQRRVRITFEPGDDGRLAADVQVTIYRTQSPGLRPAARAVVMTSRTVDPALTTQGVYGTYEVPITRDTTLEAELAGEIEARMASAPSREP